MYTTIEDDHSETREREYAESCSVMVDLDERCGKPAMRTVYEPYMPKSVAVHCCEECAGDLLKFGYLRTR